MGNSRHEQCVSFKLCTVLLRPSGAGDIPLSSMSTLAGSSSRQTPFAQALLGAGLVGIRVCGFFPKSTPGDVSFVPRPKHPCRGRKQEGVRVCGVSQQCRGASGGARGSTVSPSRAFVCWSPNPIAGECVQGLTGKWGHHRRHSLK